jgi:hypothetical protein
MSEKTKPKSAKKKKAPAQQSVLGNLSSTRPSRLARRHAEPAQVEATAKTEAPAPEAAAPEAPAATEPRATEPAKKAGTRTTKPAAPRRTAKAKPAAAAKGRTTAAKGAGRTTAAKRPRQTPRPKPEPVAAAADAPKTFQPTAAATEAASPASASGGDRKAASGRGPRAVRAGSPSLEQPERREPAPPPSNGGLPRGTELVTTAIQAAGELTKIGITVGSHIAKRALDRLPRR